VPVTRMRSANDVGSALVRARPLHV
jgi:hypothetical protein